MERMSNADDIRDVHVGWPDIFPEVPQFIVEALSFWHFQATDSVRKASSTDTIYNPEFMRGTAWTFNSCAEWIAEDLARGKWYGDGNVLAWTEVR